MPSANNPAITPIIIFSFTNGFRINPSCSHQLHGMNQKSFCIDTQSYGIANQRKRNKKQHSRQINKIAVILDKLLFIKSIASCWCTKSSYWFLL